MAFWALGLVVGYVWPLAIFPDGVAAVARVSIGVGLVVAGVLVGIIGFQQFRKAGTNVPPHLPTTALVADGIYRYSRNPLYIAQALIYAGIAVGADSLWALAFLVPTLVVIRYGVIAREEAYLERKFGDAYRRCKSAVRRWL